MRYILIILCFAVGGSLFSQSKKGTIKVSKTIMSNTELVNLDVQPSFPGGINKLYEFLGRYVKYPDSAKYMGIRGTVYVQFTIKEDGTIENSLIRRGVGFGLDEVSLQAVNKMPKWIPGQRNGKAVEVNYTLPIKFTLH